MIHRLTTVDSTNTRAKVMALDGAPHGTVIIADHQTAGRGRMGRSFHSPAQCGLYMSVILRPDRPPVELMHLTCAAALAVCDGVEYALGFRPGIKWINDIVVDHKKLAGILTELHIAPTSGLVDFAVIGIGLNCNQMPKDFPPELQDIACSAAMITGTAVDKYALAEAIIAQLESMDLTQKEGILSRYRQDCITLGKEIRVIQGNYQQNGIALDINEQGALLVQLDDGQRKYVDSGEVSVRGLYGYLR